MGEDLQKMATSVVTELAEALWQYKSTPTAHAVEQLRQSCERLLSANPHELLAAEAEDDAPPQEPQDQTSIYHQDPSDVLCCNGIDISVTRQILTITGTTNPACSITGTTNPALFTRRCARNHLESHKKYRHLETFA